MCIVVTEKECVSVCECECGGVDLFYICLYVKHFVLNKNSMNSMIDCLTDFTTMMKMAYFVGVEITRVKTRILSTIICGFLQLPRPSMKQW